MNPTLKACLLLVFSFLSLISPAQENYKDGFIVLTSRDTVRGQIDFRDWMINPEKIIFLNLKTGQVIAYRPEQLRSFSVNGETYRSYKVNIHPFSLDPVRITADNWNGDPYDSTIFLRLIVGGKLSLYFYKDHKDLIYFFLQAGEGIPEQLRIKNQVVEKDGERMVTNDESYRRQLVSQLADCDKAVQRANSVAYTENALRKLIFGYNNCGKDTTEPSTTTMEVSSRNAVSVFPLLGYFHSSFRIKGGLDAARMTWPSSSEVMGGAGMQFLLPRARGQFGFFTDLLFSHFSSHSSVYKVNNFDSENGVLDYNLLRLDVQFRYLYPTGGVRPFLTIGFSNSIIINNKSFQNDHNTSFSTDDREPPFGVKGAMNSYQIGFIGGGGILAGRWSLEARFEKTAGLVSITSASSPITSWYLLAGFRL